MAKHIREFDSWVAGDDWPKVACPQCRVGNLLLGEKPMHILDPASEEVVNLHERNMGPPDELAGTFHGHLLCDNSSCQRRLVIAGDWQLIFNDDPSQGQFADRYRLRYVNPPLKLLELPANTPASVLSAVDTAAAVLWISPPACASRLRQAVEALLTVQRVRRFAVNRKTGRRELLTLHSRIGLFKSTHPEVAEALLAMKWIGNDGTHDNTLSVSQVLIGAAIFEAALKALYDKSEAELRGTVRRINAKKGLPKTKAKS